MRKLATGLLMIGLLMGSGTLLAAEEIVASALKLYEKHRYEDAVRSLWPQLSGMDAASQPAARLALGMICLRNAELYHALQGSAAGMSVDYLQKLAAQKGRQGSRKADYFLGQALLASGQLDQAGKRLQRYAGQAGLKEAERAQAQIALGIVYWRQRQNAKAQATWSGVKVNQPAERAALAAAYAEAGQPQAATLADGVQEQLRKQGQLADVRTARSLVRAFAFLDMPERALEVLLQQDFHGAAQVELLGQSKSLNFYEADLLGSMAEAYADMAVRSLELAAQDGKLAGVATYYLIDAWMLQGNVASVLRRAEQLARIQLPENYRLHARGMQAAALYRSDKRQQAQQLWQELAEQAGERPELLAEILSGCTMAAAECAPQLRQAQAVVERGEGRKLFSLHAALGRYYLMRKDMARAIQHLEAGRDKANKNKIEVNDPVLLAGLAQGYYRDKQFSESLEIYFEMSKQYPALRQMQDAVQGIYAVEQQSAGDVKIF